MLLASAKWLPIWFYKVWLGLITFKGQMIDLYMPLGRFTNGAEQTYDLLASILERLISPEFSGKSKPSNQTLQILYRSFNRMILLKISDLEQVDMPAEQIVAFLNYCIHHQKIILSARNTDLEFLRCFCYHLYQFLLVDDNTVKIDAANVS